MDLASVERRAIEAALKATKGNRLRAAALLGINRTTLYNKLRHYARRRPADAPRSAPGSRARMTRFLGLPGASVGDRQDGNRTVVSSIAVRGRPSAGGARPERGARSPQDRRPSPQPGSDSSVGPRNV